VVVLVNINKPESLCLRRLVLSLLNFCTPVCNQCQQTLIDGLKEFLQTVGF
jgi:hypothetical protein